jgi:hypothetical protein
LSGILATPAVVLEPPLDAVELLLPPQADIPAANSPAIAMAIRLRLTLIGFASCDL